MALIISATALISSSSFGGIFSTPLSFHLIYVRPSRLRVSFASLLLISMTRELSCDRMRANRAFRVLHNCFHVAKPTFSCRILYLNISRPCGPDAGECCLDPVYPAISSWGCVQLWGTQCTRIGQRETSSKMLPNIRSASVRSISKSCVAKLGQDCSRKRWPRHGSQMVQEKDSLMLTIRVCLLLPPDHA